MPLGSVCQQIPQQQHSKLRGLTDKFSNPIEQKDTLSISNVYGEARTNKNFRQV